MRVSVGVNIGLPSIVISGHYERGYEPQGGLNIAKRCYIMLIIQIMIDGMMKEDVKVKNMGNGIKDKKYKGRDHDDRYDD
jgi:hypothetical protein